MSDLMQQILKAKRQTRKELAQLPFEQKLRMVEMMQERSLLIAASGLRKNPDQKRAHVDAVAINGCKSCGEVWR